MTMPKARVLPVPVRAWPIMSVPESAMGMAMAWIGKGWTMPTCSSAWTIGPSTPRSANVSGSGASASSAASAAASDSSVGAMSVSVGVVELVGRVAVSSSSAPRFSSRSSVAVVLSVCVFKRLACRESLRGPREPARRERIAVPRPAARTPWGACGRSLARRPPGPAH